MISSRADERMRQEADREQSRDSNLAEAEKRYRLDLQEERAQLERQRTAELEEAANQYAVAVAVHQPFVRHSAAGAAFGSSTLGRKPDEVSSAKLLMAECKKVRDGDLSLPSDILTAQAMTLDAVFSDMLRRSAVNLGEYPDAAERYMRMAMKAQAQCRVTLEALGKLARGGEQIVRHIHIDNRGGQAVVAESLQTGGVNEQTDERVHAKLGRAYDERTTLPCPDAGRNGVPLTGCTGEEALPNAWRREGERCSEGE